MSVPPPDERRLETRDSTRRVLLVNHSDARGGAGRAASRLLHGLCAAGADARMQALDLSGTDPRVMGPASKASRLVASGRSLFDRVPLALAPRRNAMFSPAFAPDGVARRIRQSACEVVHLHWITGGLMRVETLRRLDRPIVWTLHDMWPFTGGCHYDSGCGRYRDRCGQCPVLGSTRTYDLSRWQMRRKDRVWAGLDIHIVSPSAWLAKCARESTLFAERPVAVIPNGLDLERFRPIDQASARDLLRLPPDRQLILFAAASSDLRDPRKGWDLFEAALGRCRDPLAERADLVVVGRTTRLDDDFGFRVHALGELHDELSMILAIAASDLVVVPSRQDNLPNMAVEAAACGRPVVAFRIGGLPEIVEDRTTGVLARAFEPAELACGIEWVLADHERWRELGREARAKAVRAFDLEKIARRHLDLYREVLDRRRSGGHEAAVA